MYTYVTPESLSFFTSAGGLFTFSPNCHVRNTVQCETSAENRAENRRNNSGSAIGLRGRAHSSIQTSGGRVVFALTSPSYYVCTASACVDEGLLLGLTMIEWLANKHSSLSKVIILKLSQSQRTAGIAKIIFSAETKLGKQFVVSNTFTVRSVLVVRNNISQA
jgi:hypothetical protein